MLACAGFCSFFRSSASISVPEEECATMILCKAPTVQMAPRELALVGACSAPMRAVLAAVALAAPTPWCNDGGWTDSDGNDCGKYESEQWCALAESNLGCGTEHALHGVHFPFRKEYQVRPRDEECVTRNL